MHITERFIYILSIWYIWVMYMEKVIWADRRKVTRHGTSHVISVPKEFFQLGEPVQLKLYQDGGKLKLVIEKLSSQ